MSDLFGQLLGAAPEAGFLQGVVVGIVTNNKDPENLGRVKVTPDGKVDIVVKGLVFDPEDPAVIEAGIGGTNTVPNFKAIVSCLSTDGEGNAVTINVSTGLFPADTAGNSQIKDRVTLPDPCIAPIVFVTSPGGSWFATTGS